jgi:hypothetical protein
VAARFPIALLLCLLCLRAARAEGSLLPDGHLDTSVVRDAYLRSDIPFARSALEGYLRNHPKDVSAAEKVFTHLYLGATFAGDPEGRGRSEAHFRAALKFAPDVDPAGLYLPPAALVWFESLRAEVRAAAVARPTAPSDPSITPSAPALPGGEGSAAVPSATVPSANAASGLSSSPGAPTPGAAQVAAEDRPRGWMWWALGGGVAVAVGAGAFAWIESRSEASPRRVEVDGTLK